MPATPTAAPAETAGRRWFNVAAAAEYTGFSRHYIRDAANAGRLKGSRPGGGRSGHWRFTREALDEFVQGASIGPASRRRGA